jgi:hypothetical protein
VIGDQEVTNEFVSLRPDSIDQTPTRSRRTASSDWLPGVRTESSLHSGVATGRAEGKAFQPSGSRVRF